MEKVKAIELTQVDKDFYIIICPSSGRASISENIDNNLRSSDTMQVFEVTLPIWKAKFKE